MRVSGTKRLVTKPLGPEDETKIIMAEDSSSLQRKTFFDTNVSSSSSSSDDEDDVYEVEKIVGMCCAKVCMALRMQSVKLLIKRVDDRSPGPAWGWASSNFYDE